MSKYKALLPIKHNGREYCIGDVIDGLEPQYSKRLLEIKAVILLAAGTKSGGNPPPPDIIPDEFKEYAQKTNKEQIEYIETIQDTKILVKLKEYSKSNAKKTIDKKLKESESETQEK